MRYVVSEAGSFDCDHDSFEDAFFYMQNHGNGDYEVMGFEPNEESASYHAKVMVRGNLMVIETIG